ncbi:MAG TPA: tetratricopeptide repeat protein [Terracidiphilus sp.]|nr:tetratricopeptide repeat protein [Terracidiphilus sp.]
MRAEMVITNLRIAGRTGVLLVALAAAGSRTLAQPPSPLASSDVSQLEQNAAKALHNQQPALAIALYQKILQLEPRNLEAHSNLGLAYYMTGNFAGAADEFTIALRAKPDLWNILALCGLSEAKAGRNTPAFADLDRAFPRVEEASLRIAVGKQLFSYLFESGELPRAAEVAERLQELDPKNPDVLYAAHQVFAQLENRSFLAMADLDPQSARMFQVRGDRMAQRGNLEGAIAAYRIAITKDDHVSGVHFALGEALGVSQNAAERAQAQNEYEKALADNPVDEKAECRLGDIAMQQNNATVAAQHYRRALELQANDPDANEGMGMVLLVSDSPAEARAYLKHAIELDPTNVTAYYHLSQASKKAGDGEAANAEMAEFLKRKAARDNLRHSFDDLPVQAKRLSEQGQSPQSSPH